MKLLILLAVVILNTSPGFSETSSRGISSIEIQTSAEEDSESTSDVELLIQCGSSTCRTKLDPKHGFGLGALDIFNRNEIGECYDFKCDQKLETTLMLSGTGYRDNLKCEYIKINFGDGISCTSDINGWLDDAPGSEVERSATCYSVHGKDVHSSHSPEEYEELLHPPIPPPAAGPHEHLFELLFRNYNKQVAPLVKWPASGIEVKFGIAPIYLNLDQYGILKGRVWARYVWHDMRFAWDPSEFGGIKVLRVDPSLVWFPDITLYNRGDTIHSNIGHEASRGSSNALIYSDGEILVVPDAHLEAVCAEADLDDFWGMQECTLKFGSWTYDGNLIDLKFYEKALDDEDFDKSSPVKILRNSTEREVKKYDCCEEPYPSLKFHLTLQRRFKVTDQGVIRNPRMSQAGEKSSPCKWRSNDEAWRVAGNDDCCSNGIEGFCGEGEGDCDAHSECAGDLICGNDNCPWGDGDDCCMQP